MEFVGEKENITMKFLIVSMKAFVKEVADICKKVNKNLEFTYTMTQFQMRATLLSIPRLKILVLYFNII